MGESLTPAMKEVIQRLGRDAKLLMSRRWLSGGLFPGDVSPQTVRALLNRGLIEKVTIEVYELTERGKQARKETSWQGNL